MRHPEWIARTAGFVSIIGLTGFVSTEVGAVPACFPQTGSCYERVEAPQIPWTDSEAAAAVLTYRGVAGHLATVTSAAENTFITDNLSAGAVGQYWLGGFQPPGSPEPAGNWQWITGEPFVYTNWRAGEPNNVIGAENVLATDLRVPEPWPGTWNDEGFLFNISGYVVEYSGTAGSAIGFSNAVAFLKFGPEARDDSVVLSTEFSLGSGNDGIDPPAENLTLTVGSYTVILPAGSFTTSGHGRSNAYVFAGTIGGAEIKAFILQRRGDKAYALRVEARGVSLDGSGLPLSFGLTIGNDAGVGQLRTGAAKFSESNSKSGPETDFEKP